MREGETPLKHAAPVGLSLDWSVGVSFSTPPHAAPLPEHMRRDLFLGITFA